jgi:hypothetical protein
MRMDDLGELHATGQELVQTGHVHGHPKPETGVALGVQVHQDRGAQPGSDGLGRQVRGSRGLADPALVVGER